MLTIRIVSTGSKSPFKVGDVVLVDPSIVPMRDDFVVVKTSTGFRCTRWGRGLPQAQALGTVISITKKRHLELGRPA